MLLRVAPGHWQFLCWEDETKRALYAGIPLLLPCCQQGR